MVAYCKLASRLAVFLSLLHVTIASVIARRSNIDIGSSTVTIQWSSNGDTVNNLRNYHIRTDGMILESSRTSGSAWITNSLGVKALAKDGGLTATVVKLSDAQNDVEIRVFYQDSSPIVARRFRMKCLVFKPSTGWQQDQQFNDNVGYVAFPSSAIAWKDNAGVTQYRLYFTSADYFREMSWMGVGANVMASLMKEDLESPWVTLRENAIFEATFSSAQGAAWKLGNNGDKLGVANTEALTYTGSVSAVAWNHATGGRISIFYWNRLSDGSGEVREIRWRDNQGWTLEPRPNVDFKDFNHRGSLAAVSWVDASGTSQIRLYARWYANRDFKVTGYRMVEFLAGEEGWTRQQEMPAVATAYERQKNGGNFATLPAMDAVVWTYPDRGNVHIRLYTVRCSAKWTYEGCGGSSYTHELAFDTGGNPAWKDGDDIDR